MSQKSRHLGKRKTDSSARERPRKVHTSEYENSCFKKKLLFIPMKIQLITISSVIPYISGMNSTSSSLKKEKISRKRKGEGKRRRESANGREKEKEKEKKEEKGKGKEKKRECERRRKRKRKRREEKRGENGKSGTKSSSLSTPPSPDAFPSTAPSSDRARE